MRWPWGTRGGQLRWTRGWTVAAALATTGLLIGAGYAAGYVTRTGGNSVQQGSLEARGNPDAPENPSPRAPVASGTPGAPGKTNLGAPGQPGTPGSPGTPGTPGTPGPPKGGEPSTTATTTTEPPPEHKWYAPPKGPTSPAGNEDVAYNRLVTRNCQEVLDIANNGSLSPLERHGWLLVANAHACLGNLYAAEHAAGAADQ